MLLCRSVTLSLLFLFAHCFNTTTATRLASAIFALMRVRRSPHDAISPSTEPTRIAATRDSSPCPSVGHLQPWTASSHQHTSQQLLSSLCPAGTLEGLRLPNPRPSTTHPLLTIPLWRARTTRTQACPGLQRDAWESIRGPSGGGNKLRI